jgi:hypothetical protein
VGRRRQGLLAARLIRASTAIDNAYRRFDRLRSELVAAVASDAALDRYNDLAYGETQAYRPDSDGFRAYLFPWEEAVIREEFPAPPARLLVGGAGGGRETLALAAKGYEIAAFDPSERLVASLGGRVPGSTVLVGAYEDTDRLFTGEMFDGAILGWGSFSHLRTERARIGALRSFSRLTAGPILVSFLAVKGDVTPRLARFRRVLPRRPDRDPDDVFAVTIGFYHPVDEAEVRGLAAAAELEVVRLSFDERDTNWPHVVLRRPQ